MPKVPKLVIFNVFAISQKKRGIKLIFCMQINFKLSYNLIPLILVRMARPAHTYITLNKKFVKSLQYLRKEVRDEVDFLGLASQLSIN